jgi:hypothetical protein
MSRVSAVCMATGYGLEAQGIVVRVLAGQDFSLLPAAQICSGVHLASYPVGTGALIPGVKRRGLEAEHSSPTSAEVKKTWIYTSTPTYVFMA